MVQTRRPCCLHLLLSLVVFAEKACGNRRFYSPAFQHDALANVTAMPGDKVTFDCQVKHIGRNTVTWLKTTPTIQLVAYKRNVFLDKSKYSVESTDNEHWRLTIRDVDLSDAGGYMCQVNTQPMMAQIGYLQLQVPPRIRQDVTTRDMSVREGTNATLYCAATGSPEPEYHWRRGTTADLLARNADKGADVKGSSVIFLNGNSGEGKSVVYAQNLTLTKVSRWQMGVYTCIATNGIQPDETWAVRLRVQFGPVVLTDGCPGRPSRPCPIMSGVPGRRAVLRCVAEAWPRPNVEWRMMRGQRPTNIIPSSKYRINSGRLPSGEVFEWHYDLEISDLSDDDFTTYTCRVWNKYGSEEQSIALKKRVPYKTYTKDITYHETEPDIVMKEDRSSYPTEARLLKDDPTASSSCSAMQCLISCVLLVLLQNIIIR